MLTAFSVGLGPKSKTLILTDFDMAWKFIDPKKKAHKPEVGLPYFMGTNRYAPRRAHYLQELSRRDDIESWLYISLELLDYDLYPWKNAVIGQFVQMKNDFLTKPSMFWFSFDFLI